MDVSALTKNLHSPDALSKAAASLEDEVTRKDGYYWCRDGSDWQIAEWSEGCWSVMADKFHYKDTVWDEIDERPITRHK